MKFTKHGMMIGFIIFFFMAAFFVAMGFLGTQVSHEQAKVRIAGMNDTQNTTMEIVEKMKVGKGILYKIKKSSKKFSDYCFVIQARSTNDMSISCE